MTSSLKRSSPALMSFCLLMFAFEGLVRWDWLSSTLIPAPSMVLEVLNAHQEEFSQAFLESLMNTSLGLGLSILGGGVIAVLLSLSDLLKRAILPFAVFFQTVPIIAIAPLLVIYFGFGDPTVIASSFIVSLFPVIANTLIGLESTPGLHLDLFAVQRASAIKTLFKLRLPWAYTHIFAGLKISAGLSIVGAVAGEFVAGGGLGAMIDSARTQQRVDIVFAALLLLSLMGLLFVGVLAFCNRCILRQRPFDK